MNNQGETRHKVFISYHHEDDQLYKVRFEELFNNLIVSKAVAPGDIDPGVRHEYIKRIIQNNYIDDASVVIVLIGQKTKGRKHVDWEISAALNKKVGGYSGLIGILLPSIHIPLGGKVNLDILPPRLADNVKTGYAELYPWDWICANKSRLASAIERAFAKRINETDKIRNARIQFIRNRAVNVIEDRVDNHSLEFERDLEMAGRDFFSILGSRQRQARRYIGRTKKPRTRPRASPPASLTVARF